MAVQGFTLLQALLPFMMAAMPVPMLEVNPTKAEPRIAPVPKLAIGRIGNRRRRRQRVSRLHNEINIAGGNFRS